MLERNKIYCGDCLELMPLIEDKSIDMVLCDLPYGVTNNKWDFLIPLDKLWMEYRRIIKPNCPIILTAIQPFTTMLIASNIYAYRHIWYWKKSRATGFQRVSKEPLRSIEDIVVFYEQTPYDDVETTSEMIAFKNELGLLVKASGLKLKELNSLCEFEASGYLRKSSSWKNVIPSEDKLAILCRVLNCSYDNLFENLQIAINSINSLKRTFNPQGLNACDKKNNRGSTGDNWQELANNNYDVKFENYPINVLEIPSEGATEHPTQKPILLFEYLIRTYTNKGNTVLDNCVGSGTTAIACKKTSRNYLCIEKEQKYVDVTNNRLNETTV
jgi:DNA modification methylase